MRSTVGSWDMLKMIVLHLKLTQERGMARRNPCSGRIISGFKRCSRQILHPTPPRLKLKRRQQTYV